MDSDNPLWGTVMILLLLLVMAIISCMKTALNNISESSIRKRSENGDKNAADLLKVMNSSGRYVIAFELLLCLGGILTGILYALMFLPWMDAVIIKNSGQADPKLISQLCHFIFPALLIFIMALFGAVLPGKLAKKHAETVSLHLLGLMRLIGFIFRPFAWLLEKTLNFILHVFGVQPSRLLDNVTEEEIISMVNEGQEQGVFDADEAEMISNIIELDEKEAQDIMTHKKRIVAVNAEMSVEEALRFMVSENYSRYPLYEENRDNIVGILHLKDVITTYISEKGRHKPLKEISMEPYFVPDTQNINILFHEMQSKNIHMAIVIDEYGQTAGLVAMEDFLEEIVGNIQDEYDEEEKLVLSVDRDFCIVKGSISLEDLEDELDISIEHEDFDTLNGLLISILDRIPVDGEKATLEYAGYRFDILETMNKMIEKVRISRLQDNSNSVDMANV